MNRVARPIFHRFLKSVFDEAELRHSEHAFDNCCRKHRDTVSPPTGVLGTCEVPRGPPGVLEADDVCTIATTSLETKLLAVLVRLVTDYRAIFAIEGACER